MSEDRELLEKAARAAGLMPAGTVWCGPLPMVFGGWAWEPFDDDGAALRLATTLHACVAINRATTIREDGKAGTTVLFYYAPHCWAWEEHGDDVGKATRRAIVRAAAALDESRAAAHIGATLGGATGGGEG